MPTDNVDDLGWFQSSGAIGSTARALLCRIGAASVRPPREHVTGSAVWVN